MWELIFCCVVAVIAPWVIHSSGCGKDLNYFSLWCDVELMTFRMWHIPRWIWSWVGLCGLHLYSKGLRNQWYSLNFYKHLIYLSFIVQCTCLSFTAILNKIMCFSYFLYVSKHGVTFYIYLYKVCFLIILISQKLIPFL